MDEDDNVRVVVENKQYAQPNASPYRGFNRYARFPDELALSLPGHPGDDEYVPSGVWGNPGGTGPLWQVDYYRCDSGWLPGEVALKDPGTVAWILLDRKGRPAAELFWDAHTAHVWQTVSYDAFASKLLDGYDQAAAARDDRQAGELKQVIRMLAW